MTFFFIILGLAFALKIYIVWIVDGIQRHQRFVTHLRQTGQLSRTSFQPIWKKYTNRNLIANLLRLYFWGIVLAITAYLIIQEHSYYYIWLSSLALLLVSVIFKVWDYMVAKAWTHYALDRDSKGLLVHLTLIIPFLRSKYWRLANGYNLWSFVFIQFNIQNYSGLNNLKYGNLMLLGIETAIALVFLHLFYFVPILQIPFIWFLNLL